MGICGVYKITNAVNGKIYVGSSKDVYQRWKQHKYDLDSRIHGNPHLQNAWNKYGKSNFIFEIIEYCEPAMQFEREQYYLNKLKPFDNIGYNLIRQISKEYMSDNYMTKVCSRCGKDYHTFSHLSKCCDKCKEQMKIEAAEAWNEERRYYVSVKAEEGSFNGLMSSIYDDINDFWESII